MDWAAQPDPFRRFEGAPLLPLPRLAGDRTPPYDQIYQAESIIPKSVEVDALSALFFYSMAISAWKRHRANRWSLRVNPSSGNLHPTEAYLLSNAMPGLGDRPGHLPLRTERTRPRAPLVDQSIDLVSPSRTFPSWRYAHWPHLNSLA